MKLTDFNGSAFLSRSTLCSVMAQLTEDIQPTFETTLKPKAVSENCNVKFSCVVSGRYRSLFKVCIISLKSQI